MIAFTLLCIFALTMWAIARDKGRADIPHAPVRMVCGRCNGREIPTAIWHLHCQAHDLEDAQR